MKFYAWGANSFGQLSICIQSEQSACPVEVRTPQSLEDVAAIAAGGGHTLVLDSSGGLFGSGSNSHGQLATCEHNTTVLTKINAFDELKLTSIECGWDSSYGLAEDGNIYAWGSNKYGQLGVPKTHGYLIKHPIKVSCCKMKLISAGLRHVAMLSFDGYVYTSGQASKGQLGIVKYDGSIPKEEFDTITRVEGLEDVKEIACGQYHSLALTMSGQLFGWGDNKRGQLGEGPACFPIPRLIASISPDSSIHAGWTHSAVLSGGVVTTWGRNTYHQLGHSWGEEQVPQLRDTGLTDVRQLALGSEHNLALLGNGEVWSWGWNEHGNCGTGTTLNVAEPQRLRLPDLAGLICAGAGHCFALSQS